MISFTLHGNRFGIRILTVCRGPYLLAIKEERGFQGAGKIPTFKQPVCFLGSFLRELYDINEPRNVWNAQLLGKRKQSNPGFNRLLRLIAPSCDKLKYKNYSSDNAKSDHLNENFTIWIIHNSDYQNKMIRKNATNKGQFLFEIMQIKY